LSRLDILLTFFYVGAIVVQWGDTYLEVYHIERAFAAWFGIATYPCGCEWCHSFKTQTAERVEYHHQKFGHDQNLSDPHLVGSPHDSTTAT